MATPPDPVESAPSGSGPAESSPGGSSAVRDEKTAGENSGPSPEEIFVSLRERAAELADYAAYYILSKFDSIKFAIERRIMVGSIIAIGVLAAAGAIVTAVVLVCEGLCDGLSDLLGHRWAGELVTGAVLLGGVAIIGAIGFKRFAGRPHLTSVKRFEAMRRRQRMRRGHDVTGPRSGGGHESR